MKFYFMILLIFQMRHACIAFFLVLFFVFVFFSCIFFFFLYFFFFCSYQSIWVYRFDTVDMAEMIFPVDCSFSHNMKCLKLLLENFQSFLSRFYIFTIAYHFFSWLHVVENYSCFSKIACLLL